MKDKTPLYMRSLKGPAQSISLGARLGARGVSDAWWVGHSDDSARWLNQNDSNFVSDRFHSFDPSVLLSSEGPKRLNEAISAMPSKPGMVFIGDRSFHDVPSFARRALVNASNSPCSVGVLSTMPVDGAGIFTGYARSIEAAASSLTWSEPPKKPNFVSTFGFFYHRAEADVQADLGTLRRLYKVAKMDMGPVLFSGRPVAEMELAPEAPFVVALPYAKPVVSSLKEITGSRKFIETDLPMGISGTRRWLKEIGALSGVDPRRIDLWVKRRCEAMALELGHLDHRYRSGLGVAIVTDAPFAAGLATILLELGIQISYIGIRSPDLGGLHSFKEVLRKNGLKLDANCVLDENPDLRRVTNVCSELANAGRVRVLFSSASVLENFRSRVDLPFELRQLELMEIGFPALRNHVSRPCPNFGLAGVQAWAGKILQLVFAPKIGHERRILGELGGHDAVPSPGLEKYALKTLQLAKMTGVSAAVHAVEDGFLLQHVGVGCKYKAAAQLSQHDWGSHPNRKEGWTQVSELSLIKGSGERLGPFARSWYERRKCGIMIVVSAYFIELTGEGIKELVQDVSNELPCPMAAISTAAPNGGFFDGYASVLKEICSLQPWKSPSQWMNKAAILGFFFHRYEKEQEADLAVLRDLLKVSGLDSGPILFSGVPYAGLEDAWKCDKVIQFPYVKPVARRLKRILKKRTVIDVDLPIGIKGTSRFIRKLSEVTGSQVEQWVQNQEFRLKSVITDADRELLRGARVALFAETPLAAGLTGLFIELGMSPVLIGIRDESLGGVQTFMEMLERNDFILPEETEIWSRPSIRKLRNALVPMLLDSKIDLVLGSSIELSTITREPSVRGLLNTVPLLEFGFPSRYHHEARRVPLFGYPGVLAWVQRLRDALAGR